MCPGGWVHAPQSLRKIVLPVAIPGIITAALFNFTLSRGEYLYSITFVTDSWGENPPFGRGRGTHRGDVYYWGELMAGAILGSVPIAMIYVIFLDDYVSGLTAGATKGRRACLKKARRDWVRYQYQCRFCICLNFDRRT